MQEIFRRLKKINTSSDTLDTEDVGEEESDLTFWLLI